MFSAFNVNYMGIMKIKENTQQYWQTAYIYIKIISDLNKNVLSLHECLRVCYIFKEKKKVKL